MSDAPLNIMTQIKIENFNLSLFKQLINESLNTNTQLMLEIGSDFIKSLSITPTNTLMKIAYSPFGDFCNENQPTIQNKFNLYVLVGSNFKKYLDIYSELKQTNVTFYVNVDQNNTNKNIAEKIELTGKTKFNTDISTTFLLTSSEVIVSIVDDYSTVIDKLNFEENYSTFTLDKSNYGEVVGLVKDLHSTIATNHNYVEFNINNSEIKISDKVFNVKFDGINEMKENEINFKLFKNDFKVLGKHNWLIGTNQSSDKLILMSNIVPIDDKDKKIIVGVIMNKVNNATEISNNPDDYDNESDFGLDLTDYSDII